MAIQTIKAKAVHKGNYLIETEARGHRIIVDEPAELGGTDKGMNPVELLLSALGACQSIVIQTYAKQFDIRLDDLQIELEGELDLDGFLGKNDIRPGFSNIHATYHITTDTVGEKLDHFIEFIEKHCPVGDSLQNPVSLTSSLSVDNAVK